MNNLPANTGSSRGHGRGNKRKEANRGAAPQLVCK